MQITLVVDRVEGNVCVLADDAGKAFDVPIGILPEQCCEEGAVLQVPMDGKGLPVWREAVRDKQLEGRRKREIEERLKALRKRDPGGDLEL